ncbi:hypothetical protein KJ885_05885 [Patescibacteria group bacterium]|nr:hypothetical protein [Patescibacteria group bacterium]
MKILVIDDKEMHRESARETLADHELTIASSFDEAIELMKENVDEEKVKRLLKEAGFEEEPHYLKASKEVRKAYWQTKDQAEKESTPPFPFDAVLTDLQMPMSRKTLRPEAYNYGELVPYGFVLALRAALRGAKFVAVATDTDHHLGAMSASLDHLRDVFEISGAKVLFLHAQFVTDILKDAPCQSCKGTGILRGETCWICEGAKILPEQKVYERKDWGQVLRELIQ